MMAGSIRSSCQKPQLPTTPSQTQGHCESRTRRRAKWFGIKPQRRHSRTPAPKIMDKPQDPETAETVQTTNVPEVVLPRFVRLLPPSRDYELPPNHHLEEWLSGFMCPACGMAGHYRSGYEFEHQMRCFHGCSPAPIWEPGLSYMKLMTTEPNVLDQAAARGKRR